jgi:hypothetical protein
MGEAKGNRRIGMDGNKKPRLSASMDGNEGKIRTRNHPAYRRTALPPSVAAGLRMQNEHGLVRGATEPLPTTLFAIAVMKRSFDLRNWMGESGQQPRNCLKKTTSAEAVPRGRDTAKLPRDSGVLGGASFL